MFSETKLLLTNFSDLAEPCNEENYKKLNGTGRNVNEGMPDDIQRQVHGKFFF